MFFVDELDLAKLGYAGVELLRAAWKQRLIATERQGYSLNSRFDIDDRQWFERTDAIRLLWPNEP